MAVPHANDLSIIVCNRIQSASGTIHYAVRYYVVDGIHDRTWRVEMYANIRYVGRLSIRLCNSHIHYERGDFMYHIVSAI